MSTLLLYTPTAAINWQKKSHQLHLEHTVYSSFHTRACKYEYKTECPNAVIWLSQNAVKYAKEQLALPCRHIAVGPHTAALFPEKIDLLGPPFQLKHVLDCLQNFHYKHIRIVGPRHNQTKHCANLKNIEYCGVYQHIDNPIPPPEAHFSHIIIGSQKQWSQLKALWPDYLPHLSLSHYWVHHESMLAELKGIHPDFIHLIKAHDISSTLAQIKKLLYIDQTLT